MKLWLALSFILGAFIWLLIYSISLLDPSGALMPFAHWLLEYSIEFLISFGIFMAVATGLVGASLGFGLKSGLEWFQKSFYYVEKQNNEIDEGSYLFNEPGKNYPNALVRVINAERNEDMANFTDDDFKKAWEELEAWNYQLNTAIQEDDLEKAEKQLKTYYHHFARTYHPDKAHWDTKGISPEDRKALFQRCQDIYSQNKEFLEAIRNPKLSLENQWEIIRKQQEAIYEKINELKKELQRQDAKHTREIQRLETKHEQEMQRQAQEIQNLKEMIMPQGNTNPNSSPANTAPQNVPSSGAFSPGLGAPKK